MVPGRHGNYARRNNNQAEEREEWMKNARVRWGKGEMFQVKAGVSFGKNSTREGGGCEWYIKTKPLSTTVWLDIFVFNTSCNSS